uniref:Uncharacterized protein n=1 Tax=Eutreptiella gymnastica TaxID=73025 RepID=A0A7S1N0Y8_9EUGL|mmetsp:Transcript_10075/g.17800  ORF Transcript_10075/g.17800 Transcript_10075/m.17800 type:complete len:131 (+) Transcript_10075:371-763(+)
MDKQRGLNRKGQQGSVSLPISCHVHTTVDLYLPTARTRSSTMVIQGVFRAVSMYISPPGDSVLTHRLCSGCGFHHATNVIVVGWPPSGYRKMDPEQYFVFLCGFCCALADIMLQYPPQKKAQEDCTNYSH